MIESDEEWNGEDWTSFGFAVEQMGRALNTSLGQASVQLKELCAGGPVRAIGYDMRSNAPMGPIEPMEWPLPGHMYVAVSTDDLAYWLDKQGSAKPAQGAVGKVPLIIEHLTRMHPGGVPDRAHCPREPLKAELLKRDKRLSPLDLKTLRTAID